MEAAVLEQLAADEADARAAACAADRRAAGVLEGRVAGMVPIEIRLPAAADDGDENYEMGLIDPCEGF